MKKPLISFEAVLDDALGQSLTEKYRRPELLRVAQAMLNADEQSEEDFLGAQAVLLLHGLI